MSSKIMQSAAVALLLLAVTAETALSQSHVALVTELKGEVLVAKADGGAFESAVWGMQLFENDQIRTSNDSEASIIYSNNTMLRLGPNNSLTISDGDSRAESAIDDLTIDDRDLISGASDLTLYRAGQGEISALGGLRSGGSDAEIELLTPRNTKITDFRALFVWHSDTAYESYKVNLLTSQGLVWSGTTEDRQLTYPADAPSLDPDIQYLWQVEGEELFDTVKSDVVPFQILSVESAGKIIADKERIRNLFDENPEGSSALFLVASMYTKEGLLESAIATFRRIAELYPDAALPHEILGKLYSDVGLKDEAIDALQRAVDLVQK